MSVQFNPAKVKITYSGKAKETIEASREALKKAQEGGGALPQYRAAELNARRVSRGQKPIYFAAPYSDAYIRSNVKEAAEQAAEQAGIGDVVKNIHKNGVQEAKENAGSFLDTIKSHKAVAAVVVSVAALAALLTAKAANDNKEQATVKSHQG